MNIEPTHFEGRQPAADPEETKLFQQVRQAVQEGKNQAEAEDLRQQMQDQLGPRQGGGPGDPGSWMYFGA